MDLYSSIKQRKSCRKYDMTPLDQNLLNDIENAIDDFEPLFQKVPVSYRFTEEVKGRFQVDAPHYLIINKSGQKSEEENAGFVFQHLALWLDANDIGCVWLGNAKDALVENIENDLITIAFGNTTEPTHRDISDFKRKSIDNITNAPDDVCIQAAHLAPSGVNTQPWYFDKQDDKVLVYKKKLKPPISLMYKHSNIDMGIGLCHYAIACKEIGKSFEFMADESLPDKSGYKAFGIIY